MTTAPYSGTAVRGAHFSVRPSVPGVNKDHFTPDPEPDPFQPPPDVNPAATAGTVWGENPQGASPSGQPMVGQPISHWYDGQAAVPSGVPYARAQQAMQERMMVDHSDSNYVPDSIRLYQHATEGQANQFVIGRMPQNAGVDPGPSLGYLVDGQNSYDATNKPNEVYAGDPANVGRYRLGVKTNVFGMYESPIGKFGQDAAVHAYTGLTPALPREKAPLQDTAPYTPNSTGTAHWFPAAFSQIPSLFALPSETAMTDYEAATENGSEFVDRSGRF
jgi:hypothetical protein